jgi:hypothetical protein
MEEARLSWLGGFDTLKIHEMGTLFYHHEQVATKH